MAIIVVVVVIIFISSSSFSSSYYYYYTPEVGWLNLEMADALAFENSSSFNVPLSWSNLRSDNSFAKDITKDRVRYRAR